jgi:hypothetical protein
MLIARQTGFGAGADLPAMTKELEFSISLDPNFADSYALLAFAQSAGGDPATALVTMRKAIAISPRNDNYLFNLASIYMANRQPDQTIALAQALRNTDYPELAHRAATLLAQAQQFKRMMQTANALSESGAILLRSGDSGANLTSQSPKSVAPSEAPMKMPSNSASAKFLRGTLTGVDCSTDPVAVLTVVSGSQTRKMKVADKTHLVLIGAERFSCSWSRQQVAINYRESEDGVANVISLEIQ